MSLVVSRSTGNIIPFANTPDYPPDQWLINPTLPEGVAWKYLKVVGDAVVEMTAEEKDAIDNPPETMAERHAREQREGVTLENGWVMKWTDEDQNKMNLTKSRADLCERDEVAGPCVPFFEANGTPHMVGYIEAFEVLLDYSNKVMAEQFRQWQEVANG